MPSKKFFPLAWRLGIIDDYWSMQDGARPQTADATLELLHKACRTRIMSNQAPEGLSEECIAWPAYSPDLNIKDFFVRGYTKDRVYREDPRDLKVLGKAVSSVLKSVTIEISVRAKGGFLKRIQNLCLTEGGHLENVID